MLNQPSLFVQRATLAAKQLIMVQSARDKQVKIGPSEMANPCLHCVGSLLAGVKPKRTFSMYPWLGTAIHTLLEKTRNVFLGQAPADEAWMAQEFFGKANFEMSVVTCVIPGYGEVPGSIDWINDEGIGDWKSTSKKKIQVMKLKGPTLQNVGQQLLYIHGARAAGYNIDRGVLIFIPRDAATPDDIWLYEILYDEEKVNQIIARVVQIYEWVLAGRWQELPSDADCPVCHPQFWG